MGGRSSTGICFGVILACGGWMFAQAPPKAATESESKAKPPSDAKPIAELEQFLRDRGYTAVPLERGRGGSLVVVVSIAEKRLRLLCDTGAPFSSLDEKRTKELKIEWDKAEFDMTDGSAEGNPMKVSKIDIFEINGFKAYGTRFFTYDEGTFNKGLEPYKDPPIDGIFGADILKEYSGIIDVRALRLYLRKRP